jgi:hypothetical protein
MSDLTNDDAPYQITWGNFKAALQNAHEAGAEQERNKLVQDLQIIITVANANRTNAEYINGLLSAQKHIRKLIEADNG